MTNKNLVKLKLPKLIISKFDLDCLRFRSHFETEVDRAAVTVISRFSYLKELAILKVRALVDDLPFNTEGYERANTILKAKSGKSSAATIAHVITNYETDQCWKNPRLL